MPDHPSAPTGSDIAAGPSGDLAANPAGEMAAPPGDAPSPGQGDRHLSDLATGSALPGEDTGSQ